jgi:hypothetical protein
VSERIPVGKNCFVGAAEAAQQVGARGVPQVVVGQLERIEQREPFRRTSPHRDRDCAIERDDRRRLAAVQLVEERGNLRPVGGCLFSSRWMRSRYFMG